MAKRGISSVKGDAAPQIGKDIFYEVSGVYDGTVISDYSKVFWKLYQQENGHWIELKGPIKQGKKVSFNFPQKWYGKSLLVEAYLASPEKKAPPGLIVKPVLGPKKITGLVIRDGNDQTIKEKPKYGQHITAVVATENMLGDTVEISIWERDTVLSNSGHDASNQLLWTGGAKVTSNDGVVKQKILLNTGMMVKANKSFYEGGEHEYYLVAKAGPNTAVSKQTVAVKNEEIVLSPNTPGKSPDKPPVKKEEDNSIGAMMQSITVSLKTGWDAFMDKMNKAVTVDAHDAKGCEGKFCIKKGDKGELIREINIKLSGFGGNVPTDEFTDRTEKMVKQFQRDYMKIPETGKVCGNVLKAIDEFGLKYKYDFEQAKCQCGVCSGFGDGSNKGSYLSSNHTESVHKYEYPGIHRTIFWGLKAAIFYMEHDKSIYSFNKISSGYRCRNHDQYKKKPTTNHMGKAMDVHFDKNGVRTREVADLEAIRKDIFVKHLGAQYSWDDPDKFSLETTSQGASTWVHFDVRRFDSKYLDDKFFVKTDAAVKGEPTVAVALQKGFSDACKCMGGGNKAAEKTPPAKEGCYCTKEFTEQVLIDIGVPAKKAATYLEALNKTCVDYKINTCLRKAHFLAHLLHESIHFTATVEGNVSQKEYGGFIGRGLIQITGEANYKAYGKYEGQDFTSSLENKQKLENLPYSVRSAGWFWTNLTGLNTYADKNDHIYITRLINGGLNGYDERLRYLKKGFEKLYDSCKNDNGKNTDYKFNESKAYNDDRGSFAWGLWHDPGLAKVGCAKDKAKAIAGYTRFIERVADDFSATNWYKLHKMDAFKSLQYKVGKDTKVKVLAVAKQRLEALKKL